MSETAARRALVIACNFPPDAAVGTMRTLRLVRHLSDQGWAVDVLTIAPEGFRPGTVVDAALLAKVPATVTVIRATPLRPFERLARMLKRGMASPSTESASPGNSPTFGGASTPPAKGGRSGSFAALRRAVTAALSLPDREVSWLIPATWAGWRRASTARPDVVYSSGPPFTSHLVGLRLAGLIGVPWVADFRDPWARAPWREDRFEFERRAWARFERVVATRASRVIFATDTNRNDFAREYGPSVAAHFATVPNGCDDGEFDGLAPSSSASGPFVLLHAGSLYGARHPAGLLRAVAAAIDRGGLERGTFRLRFLGRIGIPGVDLPAMATELGLAGVVEFVGHVPRRESLRQMLDASALLIVQPITTVSIPAKLYEYMAAGRPILALAEPGGETAALVERVGAGISVLADDEAAIAQGLVAIVRLAREGFTPVDRGAYDGAIRAAEQRAILEEAIAPAETRAR